jgi:hypothetical protein
MSARPDQLYSLSQAAPGGYGRGVSRPGRPIFNRLFGSRTQIQSRSAGERPTERTSYQSDRAVRRARRRRRRRELLQPCYGGPTDCLKNSYSLLPAPTNHQRHCPDRAHRRVQPATEADLVTEQGWTLRRAAERFQCSPATVKKWVDRYRVLGEDGMVDASSRPRRSPNRTPVHTERRIVALRFSRRWGPHRKAAHLHLARSTVGKVLARYRMPRLACLDHGTGLPVRKPAPQRYEHENAGNLVHVDKKTRPHP